MVSSSSASVTPQLPTPVHSAFAVVLASPSPSPRLPVQSIMVLVDACLSSSADCSRVSQLRDCSCHCLPAPLRAPYSPKVNLSSSCKLLIHRSVVRANIETVPNSVSLVCSKKTHVAYALIVERSFKPCKGDMELFTDSHCEGDEFLSYFTCLIKAFM